MAHFFKKKLNLDQCDQAWQNFVTWAIFLRFIKYLA